MMMLSCSMLLVDRQAPREPTTTSSSTKSLGQALRVSLVKPGAYLSESYGDSQAQWNEEIHLPQVHPKQEKKMAVQMPFDQPQSQAPQIIARLPPPGEGPDGPAPTQSRQGPGMGENKSFEIQGH